MKHARAAGERATEGRKRIEVGIDPLDGEVGEMRDLRAASLGGDHLMTGGDQLRRQIAAE